MAKSLRVLLVGGPMYDPLYARLEEFDAKAGQEVRFRTANVPGKGYLTTAVFLGFAFMNTELEREDDSAV